MLALGTELHDQVTSTKPSARQTELLPSDGATQAGGELVEGEGTVDGEGGGVPTQTGTVKAELVGALASPHAFLVCTHQP